jgi:hypothetical protein
MKLSSPAFQDGERIPLLYTCDGNDSIPPLLIEGVPEETKSFVLIMDDPDSPSGTWLHWLAYDIPPDTRKIKTEVGRQGMNSWNKPGYGGPCPGSGEHRYFFRLFALDRMLQLEDNASRLEVEKAMEGRVMAQAEWMGTFIKGVDRK